MLGLTVYIIGHLCAEDMLNVLFCTLVIGGAMPLGIYTYIYIYIHIQINMHVHIYIYIYMYLYLHMHTYLTVHVLTFVPSCRTSYCLRRKARKDARELRPNFEKMQLGRAVGGFLKTRVLSGFWKYLIC